MNITGSDTTLSVSIKTIRTYNNAIADLDACNILADDFFAQLKWYDNLDKKNTSLNKVNDSIITENKIQKAETKLQDSLCNKASRKNERQITWLKLQRNILAPIAVVETGIIALVVYLRKD